MSRAGNRTERARELRRRQTDAERILWTNLRGKRLQGLKFRRQQPLGPYVVDFLSFEQRLVVEVDGGHHDQPGVRAKDDERELWLESNGYRVLRFWNNEVLGNLEGVLAQISQTAERGRSPSPQPSPVEGEGEDHPHPSPLRSRERGKITLTPALSGRGRGGRSPSPQPSPVEGEGEDHPHLPALSGRGRGGRSPSPRPSPVEGEGVGLSHADAGD